jgi:hypothetical protein
VQSKYNIKYFVNETHLKEWGNVKSANL